MNNIKVGGFTRVSKTKARKLFESGKSVFALPVKCRPGGWFVTPTLVLNDGDGSFDSMVNAFEYYNCNSELGRYAAFYVYV